LVKTCQVLEKSHRRNFYDILRPHVIFTVNLLTAKLIVDQLCQFVSKSVRFQNIVFTCLVDERTTREHYTSACQSESGQAGP